MNKRRLTYPVGFFLLLGAASVGFAQSQPGRGESPTTSLQKNSPASAAPLTRLQAEQVFGRFKTLAGRWKSRSTQGWEGYGTYSVIARGSVLMGASRFKDEPQEGMATMIHLDGDRLLLTHYCEAGNQPRLVASALADDGRTVTFTFLDGTSLRSRDVGHMDKVVFHFLDDDQYTSRWTWYQDGQERWLEEITHTRLRDRD